MADFVEQSIKTYSGLSSETKPTIAAGNAVPNGSRWREVDTEKVWFFNLADDTWYDSKDPQYPMSVDGDSLYAKDIWIDESDMGDFSGNITDLVDNLHSVITNTTATNPKILFVHFNRTIVSNAVGLGAYTGNFSNVELILFTSGHVETTVIDESLSNTKYTSRTFQLPVTAGFNGLKIKFHTADNVTVSNLVLLKSISVVARLQATKPDNTVINLNATAGGNQKFSLEEIDPTVVSSVTNTDGDTDIDGEVGIVTSSILYARIDADTVKPLIMDGVSHAIQTITTPHKEIHDASHYYIDGHATLGDLAVLRVKLVTPDTTKWGHFTWDISSSGICATEFFEGSTGGMANGTARAVIHANNRNVNCWSGAHTGGNGEATVLTDSAQAWTIDELIGLQIFNQTDGSSAFITDNDATTVTVAALAGGTDNDWDTGDVYEINNSQFVITSGVDAATTNMLLLSSGKWGAGGKFQASGGGQGRDSELMLKQGTTYLRTFTSGAAANIVQFSASWYEHTSKT